jgi:hypothetical protein
MKAAMQIYLFVSSTEPNVRAFTSDPTGGNLPTAYAPWQPSGSGAPTPVRDPVDPVSRAVARDGFFLMSGKVHPLAGRTTH